MYTQHYPLLIGHIAPEIETYILFRGKEEENNAILSYT